MKNISRRVFIKGMAVAAVATAASTVLAGCNVPGTVTETPVVGFQPVTKTLTFGDKKTVEMTATGLSTTMDNAIKVDFSFSNKSDKPLYFVNGVNNKILNETNNLSVQVRVFLDDKYDAATLTTGKDNIYYSVDTSAGPFKADTDPATGVATTTKHEGSLYIDNSKKTEWSKITVVLNYLDNNKKAQEVRFVLSK